MKFVVSSSLMQSQLQAIARVVPSKSSLPVLEAFLFDLKDNYLRVTASDLESTLITKIELISSEGAGKFAIAARILLDTLKEFSELPLEFVINQEDLSVHMSYQNGHSNFMSVNPADYPELPQMSEDAGVIEMETSALLQGISKTIFATANDDLRPVMNGIFFDMTTERATFVASDAHKLVKCVNPAVRGSVDSSFILHKKPAMILKTILPKESGLARLTFDQKNSRVELENFTLYCRLVEGRFPNYNAVIPTNNPYKMTVDRVALINALKRVAIYANQASGLVKLQIEAAKLTIMAQDVDYAISATETMSCQFDGDGMSIGFKAPYLIDMLSTMDASEVVLELSDPSRPCVIVPAESHDSVEIIMLLMPLLLND